MAMGAAQSLRKAYPSMNVVLLEPAVAPLLTKGTKGSHNVEGIGVGIVPPLLDASLYEDVMAVEEADARGTARLLVEKEGIFAGTSTGMNVAAAITLGKKLGPGHTIVTIACDSGLKYLAGGLFDK
jgi:cysteine synthase A